MNFRRTADALKSLPLFGVLLLCGIDLEPPQPPGHAVGVRHAVMLSCEADPQCVTDTLRSQHLWVSNAD